MFALVVARDAHARDPVREELEANGWWVTSVADRETALRSASDQEPALVVVDAEVPGAESLVTDFSRRHGGPGCLLMAGDDPPLADEADGVLTRPPEPGDVAALAARLRSQPQSVATEGLPSPGQVFSAQDLFGDLLLEMEGGGGGAERRDPEPPPAPENPSSPDLETEPAPESRSSGPVDEVGPSSSALASAAEPGPSLPVQRREPAADPPMPRDEVETDLGPHAPSHDRLEEPTADLPSPTGYAFDPPSFESSMEPSLEASLEVPLEATLEPPLEPSVTSPVDPPVESPPESPVEPALGDPEGTATDDSPDAWDRLPAPSEPVAVGSPRPYEVPEPSAVSVEARPLEPGEAAAAPPPRPTPIEPAISPPLPTAPDSAVTGGTGETGEAMASQERFVPAKSRESALPGGLRFWLGLAAGLVVFFATSFLLDHFFGSPEAPRVVEPPPIVRAPGAADLERADVEEMVDEEMARREAELREALLEEERRLQGELEELRKAD